MQPALIEVEITALGVIERAIFAPGPGLTVITGETGAGKTMVLSALSLLSGARADSTVVRSGSERATIVARFAVSKAMEEQIRELGGEVEDGEVLLSRGVTHEGKSRAAIGGVSSTISALAEIGAELLSIHGQSANFTLLKPQRAREILDDFGGKELAQLLQSYRKHFDRYRELESAIRELEQLQSTRERELERIENFLTEFDRVKPLPHESADLREKILNLENLDATQNALTSSLAALTESESSAANALASVKRSLESLGHSSSQMVDNLALLREISILVNELSSALRRAEEDLDVEPGTLEKMHERRALVQGLIKRFGSVAVEDPEGALIEEAERSRTLFNQLSDGDQGISQLMGEKDEAAAKVLELAERLTLTRGEIGQRLGALISEELTQLAMPGATIHLSIQPVLEGTAITSGSKTVLCTPTGGDEVTFLLTPHAGAHPLPINKGASGGELSRIMLAIEVVLAGKSEIPTYIFDEVDAGVGGKAAVEVGRRLALLACHAQVLVVTHLPQVAAWGQTHYSIRKNSSETVTSSDLALLEGSERANELARMMAGREESSLARDHAEELLEFVAAERSRMSSPRAKRA